MPTALQTSRVSHVRPFNVLALKNHDLFWGFAIAGIYTMKPKDTAVKNNTIPIQKHKLFTSNVYDTVLDVERLLDTCQKSV